MSPTNTSSETSSQNVAGASVVDRSRDAAEKLQHTYQDVGQAFEQTRERFDDFNDRAVSFIQQNPGACIVGAVAVGFLVGRLAARRWFV